MLAPQIHRRYQSKRLHVARFRLNCQEARQRQSRYQDRDINVDDTPLAIKKKGDEERDISDLRSCLRMEDIGKAEFYLGCHVTRGI